MCTLQVRGNEHHDSIEVLVLFISFPHVMFILTAGNVCFFKKKVHVMFIFSSQVMLSAALVNTGHVHLLISGNAHFYIRLCA